MAIYITKLVRNLTFVFLAFLAQNVTAASVADLFGTWKGTWFVDESFYGNAPITTYPHAVLQLDIHPFDPVAENFGDVFVQSALTGHISSLGVNGNNVEIQVFYPPIGNDAVGHITGTLLGSTITGKFDEDPVGGWITWKGPLQITLVPEPSTYGMMLAGLGLIGMASRKQTRIKVTR